MDSKDRLEEALRTHPCYNEEAHNQFARMHLPVAPRCNIQCNYCNRKFDCSNESRPGVTSEILSPQQAIEKISFVKEKIPNLKVIGIAGPGDPLANETTFETLKLVQEYFPDLILCISTNGLMLPGNEKRLFDLGVRFVTVTMNAFDPSIAAQVYDSVAWNGTRYSKEEGAKILISRQLEGIETCAKLGIMVKINIVMIPGINDKHIPDLVKKVKELGAYIVNILPLIPVEDTKFSSIRAPTAEERKKLMDLCAIDAKMMRHCRQCRADAIGMLDNDRSGEFAHIGSCKASCGPISDVPSIIKLTDSNKNKVAVATSDGINIDSGFGNAEKFDRYIKRNGDYIKIDTMNIATDFEVSGNEHKKHLESIINKIDCEYIVVKEIGSLPKKMIIDANKKAIVFNGTVSDALNSLKQESS